LRAASSARFRLRAPRFGETSPEPWRRRADRVARSLRSLAPFITPSPASSPTR